MAAAPSLSLGARFNWLHTDFDSVEHPSELHLDSSIDGYYSITRFALGSTSDESVEPYMGIAQMKRLRRSKASSASDMFFCLHLRSPLDSGPVLL